MIPRLYGLLYPKHTFKQIAYMMGRSYHSVVGKARTLGLKKKQDWTDA